MTTIISVGTITPVVTVIGCIQQQHVGGVIKRDLNHIAWTGVKFLMQIIHTT